MNHCSGEGRASLHTMESLLKSATSFDMRFHILHLQRIISGSVGEYTSGVQKCASCSWAQEKGSSKRGTGM